MRRNDGFVVPHISATEKSRYRRRNTIATKLERLRRNTLQNICALPVKLKVDLKLLRVSVGVLNGVSNHHPR